jgi:enediyne polyketide synthase
MSEEGIAIVGMACRYADAHSPAELWETVLAQRRAFRRVPAERLRLEDYRERTPGDPDSTYLREAAVLSGWELDRVRFRVAGPTFRAADLAHWLALDVAAAALAAAGFADGAGLPHDTTGVLVGNSLTGEFSRAQLLRLRWPYVRRVLAAGLAAEGWEEERRAAFLDRLEASYKEPFPPPSEESLAGGLSNTIAGRICNHFDLHGGGYTVDGACASSLLAVSHACSALRAGDLDVALAGGVDLSLDPFEMVGFARAGALAAGEMRIFDVRSAGFIPGEGCGFVVLMRHGEALAAGRTVHAVIRGWGVSSDGHGGISRPEAAGQRLALARAYRRAGFGIETVACFEGHGTGTAVGDATELAALSQALREARRRDGGGAAAGAARDGTPAAVAAIAAIAAIGSVKANIGHTKAAAGIAGLIKAALALENQILPPTTGCIEPHPEIAGPGAVLRVLAAAEPWPAGRPLRAAVSAMGFGGVNAHLALEGTAAPRRRTLSAHERRLAAAPPDAELLLLAAADRAALLGRARQLAALAPRLAHAELGDLAAELHRSLAPPPGPAARDGETAAGAPGHAGERLARAAIVAATPDQLAERLAVLIGWIEKGIERRLDPRQGVFLGPGAADAPVPRLGLLFTGQGSPTYNQIAALPGGAAQRRCAALGALYELAARNAPALAPAGGGGHDRHGPAGGGASAAEADTAVAQPAITAHNMAGVWLLDSLGVQATVAVGHSLGEIAALCWAGAWDAPAALRLAAARGSAMAERGEPGAMASLAAPAAVAEEIAAGTGATIAAYNAPARTVVSGSPGEMAEVVERAAARGLAVTRLQVTRAFHSPHVAAAAADLERHLAEIPWTAPRRPVASTVTGGLLLPNAEPRDLLLRQLTSPVRFTAALAAARPLADLWVEVGPGRVLADLAAETFGEPVLALDSGGPSLAPPLAAAGALFAAGVPVSLACLFADRFTRPFDLDRPWHFLANPCESAPLPAAKAGALASPSPAAPEGVATAPPERPPAGPRPLPPGATESPLDLVRGLVAKRAELPAAAVRDDSRLLSDLHLNSITVGQLVVEASRRLGLTPPASPTDYAPATVAQVAEALAEQLQREREDDAAFAARADAEAGGGAPASRPSRHPAAQPAGVDTWVRSFTVVLVERPLAEPPSAERASAERPLAERPSAKRHLAEHPAEQTFTGRLAAPNRNCGADHEQRSTASGAPTRDKRSEGADNGGWRVFALPEDRQATAIAAVLATLAARVPGAAGAAPGILLCLPAEVDDAHAEHLALFVAAARAGAPTAPAAGSARFVVVQHGGGGGGFARTLHIERPAAFTWLIDLPAQAAPAQAGRWVAAEVAAATPPGHPQEGSRGLYREAHYDLHGTRRVPLLRPLPAWPVEGAEPPSGVAPAAPSTRERCAGLTSSDVILATGGGKGIGAECALALARASGARLALLGRADPATDAELRANLERMAAEGIAPLYLRADVTDAAAVAAAVDRATAELGPVTAVLHAAGVNAPRPIAEIDAAGLRRVTAPKVGGLDHLLQTLGRRPAGLRLLVAFGSIIARTGLHGEAEYALANEWLARRVDRFAVVHPECRCLTVEWSVWSGVGMGERLGTLEALRHQGIDPIPPGAGAAELLRLLDDPAIRGAVVVSGRCGHSPALTLERPALPLLRFLETPRVYYPGIELVVDCEISAEHDPYLTDHVFRGEPLFAAVLGLEAMAQAAAALTGSAALPIFEQVELRHPVAVSPGHAATIRLAALVRAPGRVEVALRASATGFATDHFRALCLYPPAASAAVPGSAALRSSQPLRSSHSLPSSRAGSSCAIAAGDDAGFDVGLDPGRDLYGGILFHEGRFRRLGSYRRLRATECRADIVADGVRAWFSHYLPPALLLGDPAARDAAIHAIQACIPHAQLLPIGVDRIVTHRLAAGEPLLAAARERSRDGDTFTYDLEILGPGGTPRESWIGLRLRAVDRTRLPAAWSTPLLAPYLERRLQELLPESHLRVALEAVAPHPAAARRAASAPVVARLLHATGEPAPPRLLHRPDGRPEIPGGPPLSIAHAGSLILVVAGRCAADVDCRDGLGCDIEPVAARPPEAWSGLLGAERAALADLVARHLGEPFDTAATRVWTAAEALRKAGASAAAPLLLDTTLADGWLLLSAGRLRIASYAAALRHPGGLFALAVAAPNRRGAPLSYL